MKFECELVTVKPEAMTEITYTIYNEDFSIHILAGVACKEHDRASKVFWCAPSPSRYTF